MTRDEVLALPVVVPLAVAGRAWGWKRSATYDHHARGQLPFPVTQVGGRNVVTREALLRSLGIDPRERPQTESETAAPQAAAVAATLTEPLEDSDGQQHGTTVVPIRATG